MLVPRRICIHLPELEGPTGNVNIGCKFWGIPSNICSPFFLQPVRFNSLRKHGFSEVIFCWLDVDGWTAMKHGAAMVGKGKGWMLADDFSVPINVGYKHQPCKHQCSELKNHPTINVVDLGLLVGCWLQTLATNLAMNPLDHVYRYASFGSRWMFIPPSDLLRCDTGVREYLQTIGSRKPLKRPWQATGTQKGKLSIDVHP